MTTLREAMFLALVTPPILLVWAVLHIAHTLGIDSHTPSPDENERS